jgi:aminoglycoside phosphotransferase (APT) family kinase protein
MVSPAPEVAVDERMVRALLVEQHPDLARLRLLPLDAGWDNTLWRIGEDLLARLPRRAVAANLTVNEQRWLPTLAPILPLPVSVPVRVGRPSGEYPWSWSIVRWFDGTPGDRSTSVSHAVVAEQLGAFLRALHRPAPATAPHNPFRGVPLVERVDTFDHWVTDLEATIDGPALRAVWERALGASPWTGPPAWLHGDLHPANVLVADGVLSAIIDFGDICRGDPATDLSAAWMLLPPSAIPHFARAYGGMDDDLEARALGWSVLFGLMLLAIGLDDRHTYEPIGRRTLAHAISHSRSEPSPPGG